MKLLRLLLLFLVCPHLDSHAQELVRYEELTFSSDVEKSVFEQHFIENKTDYFMLFMANGSLSGSAALKAKQKFQDHLTGIKSEKFLSKKNEKKAREVYDKISASFLKKFDPNSRFEDIFIDGSFNSSSASILFGLAFFELNMPFAIRETQNNFHVVAYPDREKVQMEALTPAVTYDIPLIFKQNFVKSLKEQKIISAHEAASKPLEALFDKYYYGNQIDLTFVHLAGLEYHRGNNIFAAHSVCLFEQTASNRKTYSPPAGSL